MMLPPSQAAQPIGSIQSPIAPPVQPQQPQVPSPFVWGSGGQRLPMEEILSRQAQARNQMTPDFSPVRHWTQGLARVVNNVMGALENRRLEKQLAASRAESDGLLARLMGGGQDAVAQALLNPNVRPEVRDFAGKLWDRNNPKPTAPHYWETNNGSLGVVGPDGKPQIIYNDPTPKMEMIQVRDPATGQVNWYRVPVTGGSPRPGAAGPPQAAIDYLRSNPTSSAQFDEKYGAGTAARILGNGGGASNGANPFP
jgi:hypothetical protein